MRVVTRDASPLCARNFLRAQKAVYSVSQSEEGREFLKEALLLCVLPAAWRQAVLTVAVRCEDFAREEILVPAPPMLPSSYALQDLVSWMQDPWSFLAMGEYPYSSSYLTHGCSLPTSFYLYPSMSYCQGLLGLAPSCLVCCS